MTFILQIRGSFQRSCQSQCLLDISGRFLAQRSAQRLDLHHSRWATCTLFTPLVWMLLREGTWTYSVTCPSSSNLRSSVEPSACARGAWRQRCRPRQCRRGQCRRGQCRPGQCRPGQCRRGQCRRGQCRRGCGDGQCGDGRRPSAPRRGPRCGPRRSSPRRRGVDGFCRKQWCPGHQTG